MKTFNNERRSGGFNKGGDRGGFAKKSWSNDRPAQLFKATCAECGKSCDVPFRPTGDKPVYCNNCFGKKHDFNDRFAPRATYGDRSESRSAYSDRDARPARPSFAKPVHDNTGKQLSEISMKLDRLIAAMERMTTPKVEKVAPDLSDIAELATTKVSKPKTAKKAEAKPKKKVSKKK